MGQVAFTAAGTARVSGAFHTCVERVLGVVRDECRGCYWLWLFLATVGATSTNTLPLLIL